MGTRVKFAVWRKVDGIFIVRPPDWPKGCELSFTRQSSMINWALSARVMLKDGNGKEHGYGKPI